MRKFSILIQLRFIYVYMFIYLVIGYFYDSYLKHIGLYKFIEIYFGISFFFFFVTFIKHHLLNFLIGQIKENTIYIKFLNCTKMQGKRSKKIRLNNKPGTIFKNFDFIVCDFIIQPTIRKISDSISKITSKNKVYLKP